MKSRDILYAPWRIEYLLKEKDPSCVLCHIYENPSEDIDNNVIYRGKHNFILMNLYPYNTGHLMVTPNRHTSDYRELNDDELLENSKLMQRAIDILGKEMKAEGYNVGLNQFKAAGAGIDDHLHFHIVPRWVGDASFINIVDDLRVLPASIEIVRDLLRSKF